MFTQSLDTSLNIDVLLHVESTQNQNLDLQDIARTAQKQLAETYHLTRSQIISKIKPNHIHDQVLPNIELDINIKVASFPESLSSTSLSSSSLGKYGIF